MIAAISFALALFLSTALVPVAIRYAGALGLVDQPDSERKQHSIPIPRIGGVAIALAFFVPVLLWINDASSLGSFMLGAAIIVAFGFFDDRHDLSYQWKFFGQIVAIAVFLSGNLEITKTPFLGLGDLVPWLSYPVLVLFLLGVTNAVNLSDGLDGLAAGSSLLSLGFLAVISYSASDYSLTIIAVSAMGALTGFLRYNTHPATVFMGDAGSQFLGYVSGCLAVMVTQSPKLAVSPLLAVLILGLPILDTLMVIALRLRDRVSPFKPDRRHLHHQFLAIGLQHYQAVGALYLLNFILLALAYLFRYQSDWIILGVYFAFCGSTLLFIAFFKHSAFSHQRRQKLAEKTERRNLLLRRFYWLHEHGATLVQVLLGSIWLSILALTEHSYSPADWFAVAVLIAAFVYWRLFQGKNRFLGRAIYYATCAITVLALTYSMSLDLPTWKALSLLDLPIVALVLLLALAIRTTRRTQFTMDTQDVLVLLILLAAPLLTLGSTDQNLIVGAIVRLAVLLYAAEYVVARVERPVVALPFAVVALAVFLMRSLLTA